MLIAGPIEMVGPPLCCIWPQGDADCRPPPNTPPASRTSMGPAGSKKRRVICCNARRWCGIGWPALTRSIFKTRACACSSAGRSRHDQTRNQHQQSSKITTQTQRQKLVNADNNSPKSSALPHFWNVCRLRGIRETVFVPLWGDFLRARAQLLQEFLQN